MLLAKNIYMFTKNYYRDEENMDKLMNSEERSCFNCNSKEYTKIFDNKTIPTVSLSDTKGLGLVKCKKCGAIYVNPAPTRNALISYYPVDYYQHSVFPKNFKGNRINCRNFNI